MTSRRETYLYQKGPTSADTSTNQQSPSHSVRGSDDSGFEDFPIIDQSYASSSSAPSLLRRN